jgi:CheY-like chemotaxis protein
VIDDQPELCRQVKDFLEGETLGSPALPVSVATAAEFSAALRVIEEGRFDAVILDVRQGSHEGARTSEAGVEIFDAVKQRRFLPVVFYTALPSAVDRLASSVVRVVEKTEGVTRLHEVLGELFLTGLPSVNRALIKHIESVQRDYMWGFVADHWSEFGQHSDRTEVALLLARRLALSLSGPGIERLAKDLGHTSGPFISPERAHPMEYYTIPPMNGDPLAGDLYLTTGERDSTDYWLLITPSCDMVSERLKAEWVLMARCVPLIDTSEYIAWKQGLPNPSSNASARLKDILRNNRGDRYHFLPKAITLPDLVVDFQQLRTLPRAELGSLTRAASLDNPFAEAAVAKFARYFSRFGVRDLDIDGVIERLRHQGD